MYYLWNILTPDGGLEFLSLLALATAKATFLLAFVALIVVAFRRISAATRHLLWTSALCAALLLPVLSFLTVWEVPVLPAQLAENAYVSNELSESGETLKMSELPLMPRQSSVSDAVSDSRREKLESQAKTLFPENFAPITETSGVQTSSQANASSPFSQAMNWILAVWSAGASLLLLRLFMGLAASCFLARRGREFKNAALNESFAALCDELGLKNKVRLLRDERAMMPVACGIFRPAVLLPAEAEKWSAERQQMVLLHELAHVARRDCLTQMLAQMACAFYWFNPLVWFAARRLRIEREQACDDRVLRIGTKPSAYAHHLLEIARSMQDERSIFELSQTTSVAMARHSQLEGRLVAILRQENRFDTVSSRAMTATLIALMCFLLVSLSVVRPTAISAQKSSNSETVFVDGEDKTLTILPETLLVSGANQGNDTTEQNAENHEPIKKQNDPEVTVKLSEPNDRRIDKNDEQSVTPAVKDNVEQNISEAIQQQTAAPVRTPEAISSPAPVVNPFVNAEYRQESKPQTQNKSGDFIDEMASVGLTNLSVDELITLKTYNVTANFIRGLRAQGFDNLTPKTITNLRIYNVTPAYIEAMAAAGYKGLTLKDLTNARIYKVTPEYAKAIRDAGYPSLSIGQLINFRIYNITPELVRAARSRLGDLTPKQMISLKISGVLNKVEDKKNDTE